MATKSNLIDSLRALLGRMWAMARSSRGKDVTIFCMFLLVSYVFWVIMSLNDDSQRDLKVKFVIVNKPADVTFISDVPQTLQVAVRDKGTVLTSFSWNGTPTLVLDYERLTAYPDRDRVAMSEQTLNAQVRGLFAATTQVVSIRPDSLSFIITNRPGRKSIVMPDLSITPSPQSVISGDIKIEPDTVTVFAAPHLAAYPRIVYTQSMVRTNVKDTLVMDLKLRAESGVKIVPDRVKVTVPVEPLISKKRTVPITLTNAGSDVSDVVIFPSNVTISYLLPMSLYATENPVVSITADYSKRSLNKLPLTISSQPEFYQGTVLNIDSVEYIIEHKTSLGK